MVIGHFGVIAHAIPADDICPHFQASGHINSTWFPFPFATLIKYKENHNEIQGWMHECSGFLVAWLTRTQIDMDVFGSVGEIGVHHGKFFLALTTSASPAEVFWAVDVFAKQHLNPDRSGHGDIDRFLSNIEAFGLDPASVHLFETSSDDLTPSFFLDNGLAPIRMASIDGGHSAETTYHDLVLVSCALADGGIVVLDDYLDHGWPGVTDGLFRFLHLRNHTLAPFLEVAPSPTGTVSDGSLRNRPSLHRRPMAESRRRRLSSRPPPSLLSRTDPPPSGL